MGLCKEEAQLCQVVPAPEPPDRPTLLSSVILQDDLVHLAQGPELSLKTEMSFHAIPEHIRAGPLCPFSYHWGTRGSLRPDHTGGPLLG